MYEWLINDPIGISVFAFIRNLIYLIVVIGILTWMMRMMFNYMDKSIGLNFKDDVWEKLNDEPRALAIYFGLRVFGVLLAIGMVASAFIK